MFTDGRHLNIPAPTLDPDRVGFAPTGELRDPHNLYIKTFKENLKHHASDEISYNKSKEKLLSLLLSCNSKELEDKIKTLFATQVSDRAEKVIRINLAGGTPEEIEAATNVLPTIDPADPLQTWTNITYLVTTSASGNRRIDQDTATVSFANLRQRHGESLFDYASRAENVLLSFRLLELVPPTPATIAMRFTQGLDPSRYGIMQTTFANELHFGRDLYPTDLPTAMSNASKYQTSPARNQDHASPHNIFAAIKTKPPPKNLRKDHDKGRSKATGRIMTPTPANDRPKCLYCGRTGHNIIDCLKLLAAQTSAKSDGAPDKEKAAVAFHISTLDYFDDPNHLEIVLVSRI